MSNTKIMKSLSSHKPYWVGNVRYIHHVRYFPVLAYDQEQPMALCTDKVAAEDIVLALNEQHEARAPHVDYDFSQVSLWG